MHTKFSMIIARNSPRSLSTGCKMQCGYSLDISCNKQKSLDASSCIYLAMLYTHVVVNVKRVGVLNQQNTAEYGIALRVACTVYKYPKPGTDHIVYRSFRTDAPITYRSGKRRCTGPPICILSHKGLCKAWRVHHVFDMLSVEDR